MAEVDTAFSYTVPSDAFVDPDGDALSYSIAMVNGTEVPSWLSFDAVAHRFSGTPGAGDLGSFDIRVTVWDVPGSTASDVFRLTVAYVAGPPASLTIPSTDTDGSYLVGWAASATAGASYVLEEAISASFSVGLRTPYTGTELIAPITGRSSGVTYYYRVKTAAIGYADSVWVLGGNGCAVSIPPASAVTLTPSVASPATIGAAVMFTAAASCCATIWMRVRDDQDGDR